MRALSLIVLLFFYASVCSGEILDARVTNIGYGFQEVRTTETDGEFRYLYFGDRKLGKLGNYSISPSGNYAAFQDKSDNNIYLFRALDKTMEQLTNEASTQASKYSWNEKLEFVDVKFSNNKTQSFAIE